MTAEVPSLAHLSCVKNQLPSRARVALLRYLNGVLRGLLEWRLCNRVIVPDKNYQMQFLAVKLAETWLACSLGLGDPMGLGHLHIIYHESAYLLSAHEVVVKLLQEFYSGSTTMLRIKNGQV